MIAILCGTDADSRVAGDWAATRDETLSETVRAIVEQVRSGGDDVLLELTQRFDGVRPTSLRIPASRCEAALKTLRRERRDAMERARRNLTAFHTAQRRREAPVSIEPGVRAWREFRPIERVGVYVPGGRAAYPSSLLMAAVPARLAGCSEVVVCSPPGRSGEPAAAVLAAAALADVDELYAVGGAQAIAAMAHGTETIRPVDKIYGPGGRWVNEAKLQLFWRVAVDLPAGPSEVLVWADSSARPAWIAAEMLAQAEHGPDSLCVAVVEDAAQAEAVKVALAGQLKRLEADAVAPDDAATPPARAVPHALSGTAMGTPARESLGRSAILVASGPDVALEWVNALAAEHLVLMRHDAEKWLPGIQNAGSIFLGEYSPVAAGDYVSGTNHILPTARRARGANGLSLDDFGRWMQVQALAPDGLQRLAPAIIALAEWEGFEAHAASIRIRREATGAAPTGSGETPAAPTGSGAASAGPTGSGAVRVESTGPAPVGIEALVRPHLPTVRPYVVARRVHREGILLDANENAFGTLVPELDPELHRYPDPLNRDLRAALGRHLRVPMDRLWVGNGSDEAIDVLIRTLVDPGEIVVVATPTYSMYAIRARTHGALVREAPLDAEFDLDVDEFASRAAGAKLVFLCSPNNPTGGLLSAGRILQLVERCEALVAVDEAYIEFSGQRSLASDAGPIERLAVLRTFSKAWGLAGARVGCLVGARALIRYMDAAGLPYPLSAPSAHGAVRALGREAEMSRRRDSLIAERTRMKKRLEALGVRVLPSDANFLLFFVTDPAAVRDELARRFGVSVRDRSDMPRLAGGLRVTVGSPYENDAFLEGLDTVLGGSRKSPGEST